MYKNKPVSFFTFSVLCFTIQVTSFLERGYIYLQVILLYGDFNEVFSKLLSLVLHEV
jgi:hypothetical protein